MKLLQRFFYIPPHLRLVFGLSLGVFVLRLFYVALGPVDLAPDEAHYWEWSRYLDLSYYSKPPMVAYLNALSTSIFGDTHLGVRFFSCMALSILGFLAFVMAYGMAGNLAGWFAFALVQLTPEFAAGGLMMTPDVPSLTFWAIGLYVLMQLDFEKHRLPLAPFIFLGVVIGLAGLAKYTTALFYPMLGLYLLVNKQRRVWLLRPHIYIAGIVSLLMQWPVLYWNSIHDFIGFQHVLGQNEVVTDFAGFKSLGNFLGGQLGVLSPVTFILMLCAWVAVGWGMFNHQKKNEPTEKSKKLELLWYFSAFIFAMFIIKSFSAKVQPNWPVLSVYGGLVLLAVWLTEKGKYWQRTFYVGLLLSCVLTIFAHNTFILRDALKAVGVEKEIPFKKDPLKPALGWRGLGQAVSTLADNALGEGNYLVLTTRYQTASEMSFYMKGNPKVLYVNPGHRRQNQYDLWAWPESELKRKFVVYVRENGEMEPQILRAFSACAYLGPVASYRKNLLMRQANVYGCLGYKGLQRPRPEKY